MISLFKNHCHHLLATAIAVGALSWALLSGNGSYLGLWLHMVVRWLHVVIGLIWIGTSFYFIFLENNLDRANTGNGNIVGRLWAVHGGGFYYLEKYRTAPAPMPEKLHWFRYEAYFTWITGFLLLVIVYYLKPSVYLIDAENSILSGTSAVAVGVSSLPLGWLVYDSLTRASDKVSRIGFLLCAAFLMAAAAYGYSVLFSGRGAFIHMGALFGTIMAGNVLKVIIPAQKALVAASLGKVPVDPRLGKNAGNRSLHNNYLTPAVVFIMISNHSPMIYENHLNWLMLLLLTVTGMLARYYKNGERNSFLASMALPFATLGLLVVALISLPDAKSVQYSQKAAMDFQRINSIVQSRCVSCHSERPTDDVWKVAPNGVAFDRPQQIEAFSEKILERVVHTRSMPLANKTRMTENERELLATWVYQGAQIN